MTDFNITIQPTSNAKIIKFVANEFLTTSESYEFANIDEAKDSEIAQQLFHLPFVKTIYISQNFIAIERFDTVTWEEVQEAVAEAISMYLNSGKSVISKNTAQKIPVSIYAESTPNPNAMKFVANKALVTGIFEYKDTSEAAQASPLATALFNFPFVATVFITSNYVAITKIEGVEWQDIVMELRNFLKEYIESGKEILLPNATESIHQSKPLENTLHEPTTEIEAEIIAILDEYIKPAVAGDGGNIAFQSYDEHTKTVRVLLQGACSGCPSSTVTLKNGIETMLREMLQNKVAHVEAINA